MLASTDAGSRRGSLAYRAPSCLEFIGNSLSDKAMFRAILGILAMPNMLGDIGQEGTSVVAYAAYFAHQRAFESFLRPVCTLLWG